MAEALREALIEEMARDPSVLLSGEDLRAGVPLGVTRGPAGEFGEDRVLDPVLFFEHKRLCKMTGEVPEGEVLIPLGKADVKRGGSDVAVIATGWMVHQAMDAADRLGQEGIQAEVEDPRCLMPFDKAMVFASVCKTNRIVIVEEATKTGAFGAQIAAWLAEELFDQLDGPIQRVAARDVRMPFSPPMEGFVLPNVGDVVAAVRRVP